jgi:hypothetical protein
MYLSPDHLQTLHSLLFCTSSQEHLSTFYGKKVVIDTSIYLYKFIAENSLMESMYLFVSILKHYEIKPIFIFDGKPPPEKKELLIKRRMDKLEAEKKYMDIKKNIMDDINIDKNKKEEALLEMELLKKQFIRIKDEDIHKVKELLTFYGIKYYDANGEADQLCAYLVNNDKAWGCISDDMDMFLYGCKNVIRHISLLKHTAVLYDNQLILKELKMSQKLFCEIMILSGTDYNINNETSLYESIRWYYEYLKYLEKYNIENNDMKPPYGFYIWLVKNTKYIKDYGSLLRTYQMFQLNNYPYLKEYIDKVSIVINEDIPKLHKLMENEGFIFVN